jgi:hypothetical protein
VGGSGHRHRRAEKSRVPHLLLPPRRAGGHHGKRLTLDIPILKIEITFCSLSRLFQVLPVVTFCSLSRLLQVLPVVFDLLCAPVYRTQSVMCLSPLFSKVEIHEAYFSALKTRVEELRPILLKISRREIVVQVRYCPWWGGSCIRCPSVRLVLI